MLNSEKMKKLKLLELGSKKIKDIEGGSTGVKDDPTNPNDNGCISNPFEEIMDKIYT